MAIFSDLFVYILAFIAVWIGAGLIVSSIEDLSHKLNISAFATSFFVLGILTSIPEGSVGINSILDRKPEIFIGNLIGASLVLFIFVIPILTVLGNGIKLAHQLDSKKLLFSLLVVAAPTFFIIDGKTNMAEGIFLIVLYSLLFYMIEKKKGLLEIIRDKIIDGKTHILFDTAKITGGILLVFFASNLIVDKTIIFSQIFSISPFMMSLLILSVGTNLPELSLAIRSVTMGKKEVALGDYLGSAAANTLFFGLLTLANGKEVAVSDHFGKTLIFTLLGLGLFFYFSRSKNDISRKEGIVLFFVYLVFVFFEIF